MADIHQLLRLHGRDTLLRLADSKEERRVIEIASEVMADESERLGITYSGFCLTSLPHRAIAETSWVRQAHKVTLVVQSGVDREGQPVGVPYGSRARMILLYLQTRALQTNSREVELGRCMAEWLERMGLSVGGKTYRDVKDQANRISRAILQFFWDLPEGREARAKEGIVSRDIAFGADGRQNELFPETVELSETFFRALKEHPVPVLESAIRQISNKSMALDAYIWLAYRLHSLDRPTKLSWAALYHQFGAGFASQKHFKPEFTQALRMAVAAYPESRIEVDAKEGATLYPSPPPIAKLAIGGR
ncbi:MAG TPA: replication protein RepA [Azospirillaceae bacterium]|nr:replication protein RepA [Azospirillaceae bacterium]